MDQGRLEGATAQDFSKAVETGMPGNVGRHIPTHVMSEIMASCALAPPASPERVKLHLGCGAKKLAGFINVDKCGNPDQRVDLEQFPWPWMDSIADEVVLIHVLEHLGGDPKTFQGIIHELYRVCAPGAQVKIVVPHPRHDNFLGDPTHVRPITGQLMTLFDRAQCEAWQAAGYSNTPLALYWGVDFRIIAHQEIPDEPYNTQLAEKMITADELKTLARERNNIIVEIHLQLEVVK